MKQEHNTRSSIAFIFTNYCRLHSYTVEQSYNA